MTRKDYERLAKVFKQRIEVLSLTTVTGVSERMIEVRECAKLTAHTLKQDNAAFDQARFLTACGCLQMKG